MKRSVFLVIALTVLTIATAGWAQAPDMQRLVSDLKHGGYVIVFRHGATAQAKTENRMSGTTQINYDDISTQRLLSKEGRQEAKQVGDSFHKLGIPVGAVYTSKLNRAVETGRLVSGAEVTPTLDLTESGSDLTAMENDRRAQAMRQLVATKPAAGKNTLIVSHKPNIIDAFGKEWSEVKEGEASVFKLDGSGKVVPVARVQAADWIKAAAR